MSTGKIYIGSSHGIPRRESTHWTQLRNGCHQNKHLQRSWDKYGEKDFVFEIVELCSITDLLNREQYHLDLMQPYDDDKTFNVALDAYAPARGLKRSDATKKRMSEALSGYRHPNWGKPANKVAHEKTMMKVRGVPKPNAGKRTLINIVSPNGEIVQFDGLRRFCRQHNLNVGNIWAVLRGEKNTCKGWTRPI